MSHSHECYICRGHTDEYDDAYCKKCQTERDLEGIVPDEDIIYVVHVGGRQFHKKAYKGSVAWGRLWLYINRPRP